MQTGGFDTHATQGVNQGAYFNLMATLGDGLKAFYDDLNSQGLLGSTLVLVYSEFGRRISENGSSGTDHGAGGLMMAVGSAVRGGMRGEFPGQRVGRLYVQRLDMDPDQIRSKGRNLLRNRRRGFRR